MTLQLLSNCTLATMDPEREQPYGLVENAALAILDQSIVALGDASRVEQEIKRFGSDYEVIDCAGAVVTPGLIDCHTHLVYGGQRATEFEARLNGATYEDIARSGGGINSTVKATRLATPETLFKQSAKRLEALLAEGVTTIEMKSGYGLALEHEAKTLMVARELAQQFPVDVITTFLGAHAVPPEYAGRSDEYMAQVLAMLPTLHSQGLVDHVDAFCERIGFSTAQVRELFTLARSLNIPVKLHAEQLSDSAGTQLACEFNALSCDHLEWLSEAGAAAMAKAGTVAVLLPGAFYFLRETKLPPLQLLRDHQVPIAISTDCNPGSSPCTSLLLMLNMASTLFRMTPLEALTGATRHAAKALGLTDRGVLKTGLKADLAFWDIEHPSQLSYAFGANPLRAVMKNGVMKNGRLKIRESK